jgi:hypothetical protein
VLPRVFSSVIESWIIRGTLPQLNGKSVRFHLRGQRMIAGFVPLLSVDQKQQAQDLPLKNALEAWFCWP